MLVAVEGPALATTSVYVMLSATVNGPEVTSVFTSDTSTDAAAVPPLPVPSKLLVSFGSGSLAEELALLSNAPTALIVAVTVMVAFAPTPRLPSVHGSAEHPPPVTLVIVMFVGESVICTLVAIDGPALETNNV